MRFFAAVWGSVLRLCPTEISARWGIGCLIKTLRSSSIHKFGIGVWAKLGSYWGAKWPFNFSQVVRQKAKKTAKLGILVMFKVLSTPQMRHTRIGHIPLSENAWIFKKEHYKWQWLMEDWGEDIKKHLKPTKYTSDRLVELHCKRSTINPYNEGNC